jgi:hypothetical protein
MAARIFSRAIKLLLVLCVALLALDVLALLLFPMIHWVGTADLDITFIVMDSRTKQPIRSATIEVIQGDSGFCKTDQKPPFTLAPDERGRATVRAKRCMCFGTAGWNGWKYRNSYGTHVPEWEFQVAAPGYTKTEVLWLSSFLGSVQRGRDVWTMEVAVQLVSSK